LRDVDLDRFFRPRGVAVIGASDSEGKPNTGITRQVLAWAERVGSPMYPVNPGRATVFDRPCFASIADVPGDVDVAALLVGDPVGALPSVVEKKVAFAIIFASGFAELGAEGAEAQQRIVAAIAGSDTHVLGPNTNLNAFEVFREDLSGPAIALISQSGHQGRPIFQAQENGVRLSHSPTPVRSRPTSRGSRTGAPCCSPPTTRRSTAYRSSRSRSAAPMRVRPWQVHTRASSRGPTPSSPRRSRSTA
jgi:predicted CoA-binding protein